MPFPLFLETVYSFRGSNITIDALLERAREEGMEHLSLTDSTLHGAHKFLQACRLHDIHPIIGLQVEMEGFIRPERLHAILFAKGMNGFQALMEIASWESPLSFEHLRDVGDDLTLVLDTGRGELSALLADHAAADVRRIAGEFDSLPCEVVIGLDPQAPKLLELPSILLERALYLDKEDVKVHRVLTQLRQSQTAWEALDSQHLRETGKSPHEGTNIKSESVQSFLDRHAIEYSPPAPKLPAYPTPDGVDAQRYLRALSKKGLSKRLEGRNVDASPYQDRLDKELRTIHELGYDDYFLIVWDVVREARSRNILVGPGRGSAPGSLVAYTLGITAVDPIRHGLLFERFLNKARASMPDIDIDFPDNARDEMIQYMQSRWGKDKVALICTFGSFLKRSALRDTARVLKIDDEYVEEMVRRSEAYDSLQEMIETDPDVHNRMQDAHLKEWLRIAERISGLPRNVSTHAAGLIVSDAPLIRFTPLQDGLLGLYQTQYEMHDLEELGLLKIDFLGLANLTMIEEVRERIEAEQNTHVSILDIPLDDAPTYRLLSEGSTTGIFQLESRGMRKLVRNLRPKEFGDIATALALYRPGPMASIPEYLSRRQENKRPPSVAQSIDSILAPTEGILLYQEQIMAIAHRFAGYSLNEADILRRAVSKKERDVLEEERRSFVEKAKQNGKDAKLANRIYDYIIKFADYGFNKSHSVAYGLVAYWMAYLKANHPAPFLAVLMQRALGNEPSMRQYIKEAAEHGLSVSSPDIRQSTARVVSTSRSLLYPLSGVKQISGGSAADFASKRQTERMTSFVSAAVEANRVFNQRQLVNLVHAGAFDTYEENRQTMVKNLPAIVEAAQYEELIDFDEFVLDAYDEYGFELLRSLERDVLGLNLRYTRLKPCAKKIQEASLLVPHEVINCGADRRVKLAAALSSIKEITTKKGNRMAFLRLEDELDEIEGVVFPKVYDEVKQILKTDRIFHIEGKTQRRKGRDELQIIVDRLSLMNC